MKATILWFNQDRRLEDNPALNAALDRNCPIIPIFIWDPHAEGSWAPGSSCRWWIHHSLYKLQESLQKIGLNLLIRQGNYLEELKRLVKETSADAVFWNRRYEPQIIQTLAKIKTELKTLEVQSRSFNAALLFEPWTIANKQQKPFQVFTPFWKTCLSQGEPPEPLPSLDKGIGFPELLPSLQIKDLNLTKDTQLSTYWKPGEENALQTLQLFLNHLDSYAEGRDYPSIDAISNLSPYLHHGEISPRFIWHKVKTTSIDQGQPFLRQLGWREFAHHLLYHFPATVNKPLRSKFADFPWQQDSNKLKAWKEGMTGYPFVDAGMRELLHTGSMHNRLRMIVGSFLVKDLMLPWLEGAKWFWEKLVDADLANNTLGWQWVAGCGADAAPYFRIFNPITQGIKFDTEGLYVRKWVPELRKMPNKWIQQPWNAPKDILINAGVEMGSTYPFPIVNHEEAREQALMGFRTLKDEG